eukprot:TRINITY_DN7145_c0_g1_i1.p1 TRINITY_DN7145_c0_g1~~TRINITY_DN7145_c0_g1_i1.p1  ORF type:complete len:213 (-),score=38.00 TRINITY_DN7145_c0_g1_i1:439-1077(-)
MPTEPIGSLLMVRLGYTALMTACINGNYEAMQVLLDNGAIVNLKNEEGNRVQSPVEKTAFEFCFARLDEDCNMFENKNLCLKMAELLLQYGANVNAVVNPFDGLTLLMQFSGMSMELTPFQSEVNLETIEFLLEHGADRERKNGKGERAWDLAARHPLKSEVRKLLKETKQKYYHASEKPIPNGRVLTESNGSHGILIESIGVKCGCFSFYK